MSAAAGVTADTQRAPPALVEHASTPGPFSREWYQRDPVTLATALLGQLLVRAIFSHDYMVVQGVAMVFACATVFINFIADIATVAVDPRARL